MSTEASDVAQLIRLLDAVRTSIDCAQPDLRSVHASLESLLEFLASPTGRTDYMVRSAGAYFLDQDSWDHSADDLPAGYAGIVWDIEGQLHDTVSAPAIAENFESTPEQLLERLRRLRPE